MSHGCWSTGTQTHHALVEVFATYDAVPPERRRGGSSLGALEFFGPAPLPSVHLLPRLCEDDASTSLAYRRFPRQAALPPPSAAAASFPRAKRAPQRGAARSTGGGASARRAADADAADAARLCSFSGTYGVASISSVAAKHGGDGGGGGMQSGTRMLTSYHVAQRCGRGPGEVGRGVRAMTARCLSWRRRFRRVRFGHRGSRRTADASRAAVAKVVLPHSISQADDVLARRHAARGDRAMPRATRGGQRNRFRLFDRQPKSLSVCLRPR